MTISDQDKQVAEVEEVLGDRLGRTGFAKGLFLGQFLGDRLPAVPTLADDSETSDMVDRLRCLLS